MRETDLLGHIYQRSRDLRSRDPSVLVGPGDDAAVVRTPSGDVMLLTVDHLVEGRHFATGTNIDLIARKAIARSVSDIAAMAGTPRWGLATGLLPDGYPPPRADALFDAMARWARHWGCPLVGGDIATWGASGPGEAGRVALTVTVVGETPRGRNPVLRSGARAGDLVYVTGVLGGSLAADGGGRHLSFEPRLREAGALAGALGDDLHAMMDLSDGLGMDAGRMAAAAGVRVELSAGQVPLSPGITDWRHGAGDGEDYELLFAVSPDAAVPREIAGTIVTRIGHVLPGAGCTMIDNERRAIDVSRMGWEHE